MYVVYIFVTYILLLSLFLKKDKYIWFYLFPMFLTLATQVGVGTDYELYIGWLKNPNTFSATKGIVFKYLLEVLNRFNNERILFIVVSLIQIILLYLILKKLKKNRIIKNISIFFIILIISTPIYYQMFNTLRSSIASLIFILSFFMQSKIKGIIGNLFSFTIHPTSILMIPVIILRDKLKKNIGKIYLILYLLLCFISMKIKLIYILSDFIYNLEFNFKYKNYLKSYHMFRYVEGFGIGIIIQFLTVLFFIMFFYQKYKNKRSLYCINIGIFISGLKMFFYYTPVLNRMLEYFNIFFAIVIYRLIIDSSNKRYFYSGVFIFIFYLLSFIRSSYFMI